MTGNVRIDKTELLNICTQASRKINCWGPKEEEIEEDIRRLIHICKAVDGYGIEIELDINTFAKICHLAKG